MKIENYATGVVPTWCPGCGNYFILAALKTAFTQLKIPSHQLVICHDIGCSGNMADFIKTYGIHTLHGRALPTAIGVKMANPKLTVCAFGGDGGIYGEGLNHLIAAARTNAAINVFVADNHLYSLTTGQASPTTPKGIKTKSTPFGTLGLAIDAVKLVKTVNPDVFAKKIPAQNLKELTSHILQTLKHPGFSLLAIRQDCLAFGRQPKS